MTLPHAKLIRNHWGICLIGIIATLYFCISRANLCMLSLSTVSCDDFEQRGFGLANFAANTRTASVPAGWLPLVLWGSWDVQAQLTGGTEGTSHESDMRSAGTIKSWSCFCRHRLFTWNSHTLTEVFLQLAVVWIYSHYQYLKKKNRSVEQESWEE